MILIVVRLPLRYTNDKNRDTSAPIVGNSGSTPLHFACANGHTHIVLILLQHGAHPDRADKHGITPEALARQTGHNECAQIIRQWTAEKDQDLRDRDAYEVHPIVSEDRRRSFTEGTRRHLGVKRSIDHALNLFKSTSSGPTPLNLTPSASISPNDSPSPSPVSGQGDYGFFLGLATDSEDLLPPRRPSLPYSQNYSIQPIAKSGSRSRRPSSAENSLDPDVQQQHHHLGAGRTGSKYSLRNIFRKCSADAAATAAAGTNSPQQIQHSVSSSPPTNKRGPIPSYGSSSPRGFSPNGVRSRLMSEGGASRPYGLSAGELRHQLSAESIALLGETLPDPSPSTRPGILRGHSRSSSGQRPTSRALRFDSASTNSSTSVARRTSSPQALGTATSLRTSNSSSSLRKNATAGTFSKPASLMTELDVPESAPPTITAFLEDEEKSEDDGVDNNDSPLGHISRLDELKLESRGTDSFDSSSSSLSREGEYTSIIKEFPFSINSPPPMEEKLLPEETRLRGNSVSSTFTDNSVDNPQLSCSGTTSGSASVNVQTPATHTSPLPNPRVRIPSLSPLPQSMVSGSHSKSDLIMDSSSFSGKRSNTPLDIDISAISSHAQAEVLVQRTQQSILDDDDFYSPASATDIGYGRSPLSAKLAAYGESLALERRLKREEEDRAGGRGRGRDSKGIRGGRVYHGGRSHSEALERKFSLEERRSGIKQRSKGRRPHTADSECEPSGEKVSNAIFWPIANQLPILGGRFPIQSITGPDSRSALHVQVDVRTTDNEQPYSGAGSVEIVEISPTPIQASPISANSDVTDPLYSGSTLEYPSRSHTPDPPSEMYDSYQTVHGAPLSRVSTAPLQPTFNDLLPRKSQREHSQQMYRTNKLAKMGFSSSEAQSSSVGTPRQTSKTRFGGIRSLVHSLKGKTS